MSKRLVIAIQGEAGSYHEQAARQQFGQQCGLMYCVTFGEVFAAVLAGLADVGVVARDNTIYGAIPEVTQLLSEHADRIVVGETIALPIHHCLIGLPGAHVQHITRVHSQYMALGQCMRFLHRELPGVELVEETDTAGSVAVVKAAGDPAAAAVASAAAARLHGLGILQANIEDHADNLTHFVAFRAS